MCVLLLCTALSPCLLLLNTVIAADLPVVANIGSALRTEPQRNDGHGCFRSRGGRWLSRRASKPALVKYEGGIRLSSNATGGWGVQRGRERRLPVVGHKGLWCRLTEAGTACQAAYGGSWVDSSARCRGVQLQVACCC